MSDIFALDEAGNKAAEEQARLNPFVSELPAHVFDNAPSAVGMGVMRGGAAAGRAINILAGAFPAAYEDLTDQPGKYTDKWFRDVDDTSTNAVDFWTPDAQTTGVVGRTLGGFSEIALPLMVTAGNPSLLIASGETNTAADLVNKGVDADTATKTGLLQGAATAVGFRLPFLGSTLAQRLATGAVGNTALGAATAASSNLLLKGKGYEEIAAQFNSADWEARAIDALSGAAFGGVHHLGVRMDDAQRAAVAAALDARHYQHDTMPGDPVNLDSVIAHDEAMDQAMRQLLEGDKVTATAEVQEAEFTPREQSPAPELPPELHELDANRVVVAAEKAPYVATVPHDAIAGLDVPDSTRAQLTQMYEAGAKVHPTFDAALREISEEIGTPHEAKVAELKGVDRAAEKAVNDYGGDASRLKDIVRGTIVADSLDQVHQAIAAVKARYGEPTKFRDTLDHQLETSDGYRDVNMNVVIDGHVSEIQINYPEMLKAKDELHPLYKERSKIERGIKDGRATPEQIARISALDAQMKDRYAAAWKEVTSRLKSASDTSKPSSRAHDSDTGLPPGTSKARIVAPPSGVGRAATGTPPTSQKMGSLPSTGPDISTPPTGTILPEGGGGEGAGGHNDPIVKAAIEAAATLKSQIPTGEFNPDGTPVVMSAAEYLQRGDAEMLSAQKTAKGITAAVTCFLANGVN